MYKILGLIIAMILSINISMAGEAEDIAKIEKRLNELAPQEKPSSIKPSVINGLYEVMYGSEVFYFSADGRYILQGSLLDLETNINLTDAAKSAVRKNMLEELDESEMIVFSPKKPRHTLTVFTDIDCSYCRKLHSEMGQLNSYGIKVRYMMFPRNGINTPSYQKAVSVWCSNNKQTSLTKAKAGESVPHANCKHPVDEQFLIGQKFGVTGTPALLFEDGTLLPGYRPAKDLATTLDSVSNTN